MTDLETYLDKFTVLFPDGTQLTITYALGDCLPSTGDTMRIYGCRWRVMSNEVEVVEDRIVAVTIIVNKDIRSIHDEHSLSTRYSWSSPSDNLHLRGF